MHVLPLRLDAKLAQLIKTGGLDVAQMGADCHEDHATFGGAAKRYYFYEAGSKLGAPAMTSKARFFFIGAHSYINAGGYARDHVFIGRYCSIGRRVSIAAGAHAMGGLSSSPALAGASSASQLASEFEIRPTVIESDVWIGDGVVIMPGRRIGVGAVIAANAVVTRDVAAHEIVGGVPARRIGRRFDEETSAKIVQSRWWDMPKAKLDGFNTKDVHEFLDQSSAAGVADYASYLYTNFDPS